MVQLPGVKKAVAATSQRITRNIKKESEEDKDTLGDSPVIIDDEEEKVGEIVEPLIVPDKSQGGDKELKVDIEALTFKPGTEYRVQKARRGMRFCPGDRSRMHNVPVTPVDATYNELQAAKSLVGLSEPQPKTGTLRNLRISKDNTEGKKIKDSREENKKSKKVKDSIKQDKDTKVEKVRTTKKGKVNENKQVPKEKVPANKDTTEVAECTVEKLEVKEQVNIRDQVQSLIDEGMNVEETKKKINTLKGIIAMLESTEEVTVTCKMSDAVGESDSKEGTSTGEQLENVVPDSTVKLSSVNYTVQMKVESDAESIETSEVNKVVRKFIDDNSEKEDVKLGDESKQEEKIVSEMKDIDKSDKTEQGGVRIKEIEHSEVNQKEDTVSEMQELDLKEAEK